MAERNPLWVSDTGGVLSTDDTRIGTASLWVPGSSNVNTRAGFRPAAATVTASPGYVAQQTVADKTVKVNAFQAVIPASRATGSFVCTLDAVKNIDLLTLHPAHPTLQRNDLIVAQVSDKPLDGANGFNVFQVVGSPSATPSDPAVNTTNGAPTNSPDYLVLARVRVTANAPTITTSMIDTFPNGRQWVTAIGGVLPVATATERAGLSPYDGLTIWRQDRQWTEVYSITAGGWLVQGQPLCSTTADLAAITTPYTNQLAFVAADHSIYRYTGSAWVLYRSGDWVSYSASMHGMGNNSGTTTARYTKQGTWVRAEGLFVPNPTADLGLGTPTVDLPYPVSASAAGLSAGTGRFLDGAGVNQVLWPVADPGATQVSLFGMNSSRQYTAPGAAGYSWNNSSKLEWRFEYEASS
jgi:hypothetical protein